MARRFWEVAVEKADEPWKGLRLLEEGPLVVLLGPC